MMPDEEEREKLAEVIRQWNNNRLDLFEISEPDENLEFHGVMRFYFEDDVDGNVATKCLRVCSTSSTCEVVGTLAEKFRPDMKMLSTSYALYEVQARKERKLEKDERPLTVQLNWKSNNREGRFVLRKDNQGLQENQEKEKGGMIQNFRRTLSRKDKKTEKNKTKSTDKAAGDEKQSSGKPPNNTSETKQRCTENKMQKRQTSPDPLGLPAAIRFCDSAEDAVLSAVMSYTNSSTVHFKLSPAYALYAVARFALQRRGRGPQPPAHASVASVTHKMVDMARNVIQKQRTIAGALAFWMANASELLNFLKNDKDLGPLTQPSQLELSHLVHQAYSYLQQCLQGELMKHLPTFLSDPEQHGALPAGFELVLNTLMNSMALLRRCRVNPALTIQLFSQLFHFISAWLFNQLMSPEAGAPGLRSHYWGAALRQRLAAIEAWAERQGLELAADCHLGHVTQATTILTMNKYSIHNVKDIQNASFKLNSLQLHTLLSNYLYATNEPKIPHDVITAVVTAAEASADNLIRGEGRDIQLEESLDLHLPFLLPEGGYSCDTVRGVPPGFTDFLEPICQKGLCSLTCQPNKGDWTVYFSEQCAERTRLAAHSEPEIVTFTLNKPLNSGMGLSIVAAKGAGQGNLGIYIKSIVKGGPAEMNGRLTAGDQLLCVDGHSLIGLSQERAAAIMMQTGPVVTLQVAKFGASHHGLEALLREPSPVGPAGDRRSAAPNYKALVSCSVMDPGPCEGLHKNSKKKKDQMMQRNRQLYRSDPNITSMLDTHADVSEADGDEPALPVVRGNNVAAASSINLCADTFHREYMTLPTPKSQDKNIPGRSRPQHAFISPLRPVDGQSSKKTAIIRQAMSQENLCMDSGGPLLDRKQNTGEKQDWSAKQTMTHYTSFPIRSSVSSHDILMDGTSPKKQQQGPQTRGAGIWRTPFSHHPTPSMQPVRIDMPVTRAVKTQLNPPLSTFQGSSMVAVKKGQSQVHQSQDNLYACPISAIIKLPQPLLPSQQQRGSPLRGQVIKPQISLSPVKHVSFQEPPIQQKISSLAKQKEPRQLCDPRRGEALENLDEQREVQAKAKAPVEEKQRLHRLSLEWQFEKRLRELQQRGEDGEEDEDLDLMMRVLQLDRRVQNKRSSEANVHCELKELSKQVIHLSQTEESTERDQRSNGLMGDVQKMASNELLEERIRRAPAPETLTFRERQRLFSLASSA
ncbi:afadin [Betta splendens]|uniref:Afadin n=1 Tax=Betta splendens TaxID=158456 RepID=A0A9W2XJY5_BETSP|nr:afadin [Betta splendens]